MRIVVCPPTLALGGSQINAIDLGGAVQQLGHDVVVLATPGPLEEMIARRGLRFAPLLLPRRPRPSLAAMRTMRRLVRREAADVIHAYETSPALEAYFGAYAAGRVPLVTTIMSWEVPRRFPRSVPITVGTTAIVEEVRRTRGGAVHLMEPPINTDEDDPAAVDAGAFVAEHGLDDGRLNVVVVSRLEVEYKMEGIERAMAALAQLAREIPARLVVVGGGPAYERLLRRAEEANAAHAGRLVVMTGPMVDPRPAIAAADVVLGQGGSALRGMAFAKPVICLGEKGFSEVVEPATRERFLKLGFYGLGDGGRSPGPLVAQLSRLLSDDPLRKDLGAFGRALVCERYSLASTAGSLVEIYREAAEGAGFRPGLVPEVIRTAAWVGAIKLKQRLAAMGRLAA